MEIVWFLFPIIYFLIGIVLIIKKYKYKYLIVFLHFSWWIPLIFTIKLFYFDTIQLIIFIESIIFIIYLKKQYWIKGMALLNIIYLLSFTLINYISYYKINAGTETVLNKISWENSESLNSYLYKINTIYEQDMGLIISVSDYYIKNIDTNQFKDLHHFLFSASQIKPDKERLIITLNHIVENNNYAINGITKSKKEIIEYLSVAPYKTSFITASEYKEYLRNVDFYLK